MSPSTWRGQKGAFSLLELELHTGSSETPGMGARGRTPVLCQSSKLSQLLCRLCVVSGATYFHHGAPLQAQSEGNNCLCPEMLTTVREIVFFSW